MADDKPEKKSAVSRRGFLKTIGGGTAGVGVAGRLLGKEPATQAGPGEVETSKTRRISLTVNGRKIALQVEARETLLQVVRDRLRLTGTKRVCNRGECGGCTVLLDGKPVYACHMLAVQADGKGVETVEGLAAGGKLNPLQQAFIDKDGYQCGYCTPGFLMAATALLRKTKTPTLDEIKSAVSGNLCRCGNYPKIHAAVAAAAEAMRRG
ncbi:MAG: (2Fe-2S)-binding protein [Candidatus Aminicenantes bacterium]|nr:(2Fe-2S)-binding protein [Candidatus Aminicenantes bacterium]